MMSGLVIRLGLAISENPTVALLISLCTLTFVAFGVTHPATRSWVLGIARGLPWVGDRMQEFELVRLYRSLGMLFARRYSSGQVASDGRRHGASSFTWGN
jgi:type II secretory pathway component PulF